MSNNDSTAEQTPDFTTQQLEAFADAAQAAARLGGKQLLSWMGKAKVENKGPRDFVTQADLASQDVIANYLLEQFPDHRFLGEESIDGQDGGDEDGSPFCWIVDPLDGTTNFVHQLPSFSVSIGLHHAGVPLVGVVWDPILSEMFVGIRGHGATLNGDAIQNSGCEKIEDAMVVISFTKGVTRNDLQVQRFLNLLETAGTIRRLGSAALNLSYVAMGRVDGYWAQGLKTWDTAAGALIAVEGGATIKTLEGQPFSGDCQQFVCASSEPLHAGICQTLLDERS